MRVYHKSANCSLQRTHRTAEDVSVHKDNFQAAEKRSKLMGLTLTEKILKNHIVDGEMIKGSEIGIRIDQTLTQDATGTMAYLEFEAMGVPRVKTERSVAYIDHNTLQNGFENADDTTSVSFA